jgi:predicted transcriptional regulator
MPKLGACIRQRREQLELSVRDAAARAGMSTTTWIHAEGSTIRSQGVTLARIERALNWPSGTCRRILAGEDPPVVAVRSEQHRLDDVAVMRWAQDAPGLEAHERAFILAMVARSRQGR